MDTGGADYGPGGGSRPRPRPGPGWRRRRRARQGRARVGRGGGDPRGPRPSSRLAAAMPATCSPSAGARFETGETVLRRASIPPRNPGTPWTPARAGHCRAIRRQCAAAARLRDRDAGDGAGRLMLAGRRARQAARAVVHARQAPARAAILDNRLGDGRTGPRRRDAGKTETGARAGDRKFMRPGPGRFETGEHGDGRGRRRAVSSPAWPRPPARVGTRAAMRRRATSGRFRGAAGPSSRQGPGAGRARHARDKGRRGRAGTCGPAWRDRRGPGRAVCWRLRGAGARGCYCNE